MKEVVWIAAYPKSPKSGNTWVRFIVANLLFGTDISVQDYQLKVPETHEGHIIWPFLEEHKDDPVVYLKTHHNLDENSEPLTVKELPNFDRRTKKAIYVVRHPLDIIPSLRNWSQLFDFDDLTCMSKEEFADWFIENEGIPFWGNWNEHVHNWVNCKKYPVLVLHYEQMLKNLFGHVRRIANFLELNVPNSVIKQVTQRSTFESMKKLEEENLQRGGIFMPNPDNRYVKNAEKGLRFMNKGKPKSYLDFLSEEQINKAMVNFDSGMRLLGYK